MEKHSIRITNTTHYYPGATTPAIDNVSLDIAAGEFMTFLGPSGSGKSTLMSVIAGFVSLDLGTVEIDGEDITNVKAHKRGLGVAFQHYALFPHMTVSQNIAYPLKQRGFTKSDIADKVNKTMQLVQLNEFADRYPKQLSGGQQQRVALARAVVYDPRALLLDEPLGALDKKLRDQLQGEIKRMHRELGMTFVFVTHDQEEALTLSDRIAIFKDGRIVQVGTPDELYSKPNSTFVATFLGESNMFAGPERDTKIMVRPEYIELHASETALGEEYGSSKATISDISFAGSHLKVALDLPNGEHGMCMLQAGNVMQFERGNDITAVWKRKNQTVIANEA